MPTYRITDPNTGKVLRVTGDSPPTEQELSELFAASAPAAPTRTWGDTAADVATGAVKGAANTAIGLGQMVHRIPGVSRAVDALYGQPGLSQASFPAARALVQPTNTPQQVGYTGEQIGEFFIPAGTAAKAGLAAEAGKSALTSLAQSGNLTDAAISGGLTAAAPVVSNVVGAVSDRLKTGAQKTMAQALGATKEWAKSEAEKLAPEMLTRGVRGSRAGMLAQARSTAATVGQALNDAYTTAAAAGETVAGPVIRGQIQLSADALKVKDAAGKLAIIPGTERVIKRLEKLDAFVASLGTDIPVDKAAQIKRTWDAIVSQAGLFGQKAGASATDKADAWAIREASGAFRELLNTNPTIAALNKESSFWTGLRKVLRETERRTQAQSGGIVSAGMGGAGAIAGAMSGDSLKDRAAGAVLGGVAGRQAIRVLQSPQFRTAVSGPLKNALADALASGNADRIGRALARVAAAVPSQLQTAAATP